MKDEILRLLRLTARPGIEKLIEWMEQNGFFTAPCSTQHHLCVDGGLMEHSLNVYHLMYDFAVTTGEDKRVSLDSIIICSLLHDIGKCGQFGKQYYVENYIKDGKPTKANPEPQMIRSEKKPFLTNAELYNVPHEIRSLSIVDRYIDLTEDEQFAILYHNGAYGLMKYEIQGKETPMYLLLHMADMWASRVLETNQDNENMEG